MEKCSYIESLVRKVGYKMKMKWKAGRNGNTTLKGNGFYISFRGGLVSDAGVDSYLDVCDYIAQNVLGKEPGNRGMETALVKTGKIKENEHFLILDGDWREDYEKLVKLGYGACKDFYENNKKKHQSWWSSDYGLHE